MSKRKPMDKAQVRERRNRLLESAAGAELSLTEGVREMRAIAGMTQEEFARHREVSARVIKAIELGQGNPTVGTLNRIGQFFGLEVGFVPVKRMQASGEPPRAAAVSTEAVALATSNQPDVWNDILRNLQEALDAVNSQLGGESLHRIFEGKTSSSPQGGPPHENAQTEPPANDASAQTKRNPRSS